MNARIFAAILRKDLRSLLWLALLTALLFAADVFILRWELVPMWAAFRQLLLLGVAAIATLAVIQLDAPVSLVDDWLCRPVPKRELVAAKLAFLLLVAYLPGALATLVAGLCTGASLAESLQDALLLRDAWFPLVLPLLLLTALVTRTLVQGIGVLIALFVCMFVIPTPFTHGPGPLRPGIGDELMGVGMGWLATVPARLLPLLLAALGFWLVYWRRRILAARVLLAVAACLTVTLFLVPMWLLPWKSLFAAQVALNPAESPAASQAIYLQPERACFPATRLRAIAGDAAFSAARQVSGAQTWARPDLRDWGADAVEFLTVTEPRRIPPDWRVKPMYVQADYLEHGTRPLFSLRPAYYNTGMSHAWALPESALKQLAGHDVSLRLTYFFTLLQPRTFSLPTDGLHHALPGLGYCSAEVNGADNRVDVECFTAFHQPAQLTAELDGIAASRAAASADFAPGWTKWPFSQRTKLSIGSPQLARHDTITVTAWDVAGYLERSLTFPGILGGETSTCALPSANGSFQASRWRDAAPHEPSSISVADGVQVELLDFGGQGSPILLLPGLGATAHSYDEIAPLLARHHRVVAMTRRGAGYSSKPDFGYDTPRLGQDVLAVMDALKLEKVLLVGHSIAGEELTWLGGHHADRFNGLVYLDAAYDRSKPRSNPLAIRLRELGNLVPAQPPIPPAALLNYEAMVKWLEAGDRTRPPEGELIAGWQVDKPFLGGTPSIDARTQQAISAAIQPPDYDALKVPALAVYAIADPNAPLPPWYDPKDAELMAVLKEIEQLRGEMQRQNIELFRAHVRNGKVLEIPGARHYILQSNPQEVVDAVEKFVAAL